MSREKEQKKWTRKKVVWCIDIAFAFAYLKWDSAMWL